MSSTGTPKKNRSDTQTGTTPTRKDANELREEARRLLDFRKHNIHQGNMTPCPECATLVSVSLLECPRCDADISDHVHRVRAELSRLEDIAGELYDFHESQLEHHAEFDPPRPLWATIRSLFSDPNLREELTVVLPSLLVFFTLVATLRVMGNGVLFWSVAVVGGGFSYLLLTKSRMRRYVTLDLYRFALVLFLMLIATTAIIRPMPLWEGLITARVEVTENVANLRSSPSTKGKVMGKILRGDELRVLGREGAWYKVVTEDGRVGWVYSGLVSD